MTNEEKAEELAKGFGIDYYAKGSKHPIDHSFDECYKSAREMAEWKDNQFKEYLEKKAKNNVPPRRTKDELNCYSPSYFEGRDDVLYEILNDLFKDTNSEVLPQKSFAITEDDYRKILDNIFEGNKEKFRKQFEDWLLTAPVIEVEEEQGKKRFNDIIPNELYEKLVEKGMPELRETYAAVFDWLESKYIGIGIKHHWSGMVYQGYDWQVCQFDKSITPYFGTYYTTWQNTANAAIERALELIK